MPSAASEVRRVIDLHRAQLQGVIELRGVRRMRKLYAEVQDDVRQRLASLLRERKGQTFTAQNLRLVLIQVNDGIRMLDEKLGDHLAGTGRLAGSLAQKHLISATRSLEKKFTGLTPVLQVEQAAVLQKLYDRASPTLLQRYKKSVSFYRAPVVQKVRASLSRSILANETVDQAVDGIVGIGGVFERERWRAERIVRTELSYSYGVVKQATMEQMRSDLPDLQKKLIATFDNRTGDDSKELHGQTVPIDQPFKWRKPSGEVVDYMQPPNRPNDREVVIPWRPGWQDTAMTEEDPSSPPGPVRPSAPRA